jgi:hypothetical protein
MSAHPILDQAAHTAAGVLILFPAVMWPSPFTFALCGAEIGLVREISEGGALLTRRRIARAFNRRSLLDIAFWTLGGALAGLGTL